MGQPYGNSRRTCSIPWLFRATTLQKLLAWQLVPHASSSIRERNPSSHRRQCSIRHEVVMWDLACALMARVKNSAWTIAFV